MTYAKHILLLLTIVWGSVQAQIKLEDQGDLRRSDIVEYSEQGISQPAKLLLSSSKSKIPVYNKGLSCSNYCYNNNSKQVDFVLEFGTQNKFFKVEGESFTSKVKVKIKAWGCNTTIPVREWDRELEISDSKPFAQIRIPIDLFDVFYELKEFEVLIDKYDNTTTNNSRVELNEKVIAYYDRVPLYKGSDYSVKPFSMNQTGIWPVSTDLDDTEESYEATFTWNHTCAADFNNYQFQLLRLYNTDPSYTDPNVIKLNDDRNYKVDWSKALTIETQSMNKSLTIPITEGTGFYMWRVRGIGNEHRNGSGHHKNLGTWSRVQSNIYIPVQDPSDPGSYWGYYKTHSATEGENKESIHGENFIFYFNQPDEERNWIHSRVFTESNHDVDEEIKRHESMTFANGLQQVKQTQTKLSSSDNVITSQTVHDFSGRPGLQTIPVPKKTTSGNDNEFGYATNFLGNYTADNFDSDDKENNPDPINDPLNTNSVSSQSYDYYTSSGSPIDNLPDAKGYPFTRTLYYQDGSSRVKEQSGVGSEHSIKQVDKRTQRIVYSSVAEDELLRVFGAEAPSASSVHKVITTDPNDVTSIAYINKEGQTIATCLASDMAADDNSHLLPLDSYTTGSFVVTESVTPNYAPSQFTTSRYYDLYLKTAATVNFDYDLTPKAIQQECGEYCLNCSYFLDIYLIEIDNPTNMIIIEEDYEVSNSLMSCPDTTPFPSLDRQSSVPAGHYQVVQQLRVGKTDANGLAQLGENFIQNELDLLSSNLSSNIETRLVALKAALNTDDLSTFYEFLLQKSILWGISIRGNTLSSPNPTDTELKEGDVFIVPLDDSFQTGSDYCIVIELPYFDCVTDCPSDFLSFKTLLEQTAEDILEDEEGPYQDTYADPSEIFDFLEDEFMLFNYYAGNTETYLDRSAPNNKHFLRLENLLGHMRQEMYVVLDDNGDPIIENGVEKTERYYSDCELWECFNNAVSTFKMAHLTPQEVLDEASMSGVDFDIEVNLINEFLNCTGYRYITNEADVTVPITNSISGTSTALDHYLVYAYRSQFVPKAHGNITSTESLLNFHCVEMYGDYLGNFYYGYDYNDNIVLFDGSTSALDENKNFRPLLNLDLTSNFRLQDLLKVYGSNNLPTKDDLYGMFAGCVQSYQPDLVSDEEAILQSSVIACQDLCESNRSYFEKEILIAFARESTGISVSYNIPNGGVEYIYYRLEEDADGVETLIEVDFAYTIPISSSKIKCMVDDMIKDCQGNCAADDLSNIVDERNPLPKLKEQMLWLTLGELDVYLDSGDTECTPDSDDYSKCNKVTYSDDLTPGELPGGISNELIIIPDPEPCYPSFCYCWKDPCEYRRVDMERAIKIAYAKNGFTIDGNKYIVSDDETVLQKILVDEEGKNQDPLTNVTSDQIACEMTALMTKCYADFEATNAQEVIDGVIDPVKNGADYLTQLERLIVNEIKVGLPAVESNTLCSEWPMEFSHTFPSGFIYSYDVDPFLPLSKCENLSSGINYNVLVQELNNAISEFSINYSVIDQSQSTLTNLYWLKGDGLSSATGSSYYYKRIFDPSGSVGGCGVYLRFEIVPFNQYYSYLSLRVLFGPLEVAPASGLVDDVFHESIPDTEWLYELRFIKNSNKITDDPALGGINLDFIYDLKSDRFEFIIDSDGTIGVSYKVNTSNSSIVDVTADTKLDIFTEQDFLAFLANQTCYKSCNYNLCVCYDGVRRPIIETSGDISNGTLKDCNKVQSDKLLTHLYAQVETQLNSKVEGLKSSILNTCVGPSNIKDKFVISYGTGLHHYTLYYYDRSGNLVRTVPPAGVDLLAQDEYSKTLDPTEKIRENVPYHNLVTDYEYNSIGQLIRQHTPDGGTTTFIYDDLSRLRFSQNAEQAERFAYSYTKYDNLSRTVGVGEFEFKTEPDINVDLEPNNQSFPTIFTNDYRMSQTIRTRYSTPAETLPSPYENEVQENLRNRISYVHNGIFIEANPIATYYSYDPHGNVKWLIQYIPELGAKMIKYDYDLISGNVLQVSYQPGEKDQFYHRYFYDADERITKVETSSNGQIWEVDANYTYYPHGALQRTALGHDNIQGVDYTYTIHGWLKAMNHSSNDLANDPNKDGDILNNNDFAPDVFGAQLNYYDGDYASASGSFSNIVTPNTNNSTITSGSNILGTGHDLYNGNISAWQFRTERSDGAEGQEQAFTYRYDQLNRIKGADYQNIYNNTTNGAYNGYYQYDANGNLISLTREALINDTQTQIDDFTYSYLDKNGSLYDATQTYNPSVGDPYNPRTNKLSHVDDEIDSDVYFNDVDDQDPDDLDEANYSYNAIGELISDEAEGINQIDWSVYHKVKQINKILDPLSTGGLSSKQEIGFSYDPMLHRVAKEVNFYDEADQLDDAKSYKLFYVCDAQGNVMATYKKYKEEDDLGDLDEKLALIEQPIYATERIGMRAVEIVLEAESSTGADVCSVPEEIKIVSEHKHLVASIEDNSSNPVIQTELGLGGGIEGQNGGGVLTYKFYIDGAYYFEHDGSPINGSIINSVRYQGAKAGKNQSIAEDKDGNVKLRFFVLRENNNGVGNHPALFYPVGNSHAMVSNASTITNALWSGRSSILHYGNENYVLFTAANDGNGNKLKAYKIIRLSNGTWEVFGELNVPGAGQLMINSISGFEDNTGDYGTGVFAVTKIPSNNIKEGALRLVKFSIDENDVITSKVLHTFSVIDVDVDDHFDAITQISPDGGKIAVALKIRNLGRLPGGGNFGGFASATPTQSKLQVFKLCSYSTVEELSGILPLEDSEDILSMDFDHISPSSGEAEHIYLGIKAPGVGRTIRLNSDLTNEQTIADLSGTPIDAVYLRRGFTNGKMEFISSTSKTDYQIGSITGVTGQILVVSPPIPFSSSEKQTYFKGGYASHVHKVYGLTAADALFSRNMGEKLYEIKDHLGNVRSVVTDIKKGEVVDPALPSTGQAIASYKADVRNDFDYYPFGMMLPNTQEDEYLATFESSVASSEELDFDYNIYDANGNIISSENSYDEVNGNPNQKYNDVFITSLSITDANSDGGIYVLKDEGAQSGSITATKLPKDVMTKTFEVTEGDVLNLEAYATYTTDPITSPRPPGGGLTVPLEIAAGIVVEQVLKSPINISEGKQLATNIVRPLFQLLIKAKPSSSKPLANQINAPGEDDNSPVVSLNYEVYNVDGVEVMRGKSYMSSDAHTTLTENQNKTDHLQMDEVEMPKSAAYVKVWLSRDLALEATNKLVSEDFHVYYDDYKITKQADPNQPFYRYGFQGQERDDEIKGKGNSVNYAYRMHDPRIGRFFAVDPLAAEYSYNSPYAFSENRTVDAVELEGLEKAISIYYHDGSGRAPLYSSNHKTVQMARDKVTRLQHNPNFKWATEEASTLFTYTANDKYDDIHAGTISLYIQADGSVHGYFDGYYKDRIEQIEENKFLSAKPRIIMDGIFEIGIGVVGLITASVEEVLTGGGASTLVITQITFSMDELAGGINKVTDPRSSYEGNETKPIKYLLGAYLGEKGELVYDVIDITTGAIDIAKSDKLIDVVGVYDTYGDAEAALKTKE